MSTELPEYSDDPAIPLPTLEWATQQFLASYLRLAMERHKGHQGKASAELGIHRNTLMRLCERNGVSRRHGRPEKRQPNPTDAAARRLIGLEPLPPKG